MSAVEVLTGPPPSSRQLHRLSDFVRPPIAVTSYRDYPERKDDALRPPVKGEETFGLCVPAAVNRAR